MRNGVYATKLAVFGVLAVAAASSLAVDSDGDGVDDIDDNCSEVANADQRDSNGDGFGNVCDADLNNDLIVNVIDLGILKGVFFTADADADSNGDGIVNAVDLGAMRNQFFGPPGPGPVVPQGFTSRPMRIEGDFDNNGIVDAMSMIQYNADGSVSQQFYTVPGDGTPDLFQFGPAEGFQADYGYDAEGRLSSIDQDNFTAGNDFATAYQYGGDGRLERTDETVFAASGAVLFQSYTTYEYANGLRVRDDVFQLDTDTLILVRNTVFDGDGLVDSASWVNQFGPGGVEFDFTWNGDGKLTEKLTDVDANGTFDETIQYVHQGGRIVQRVTTGSLSFLPPNYTEFVYYDSATGRLERIEYDANSDGSIDAVQTIVWEEGPCQRLFLPDSIPTGGFDGDPDSPIGDLLFCGP